ncbi:MAG: response regulator transcription factor [Gallionella sp.]|jgi:DNA-binding NarL/FixJ family response regulator|nr:response regulator transcription factor [Gallionella sp.]MCK9352854.1 response regulator transcription factor [Gallionella sp.]
MIRLMVVDDHELVRAGLIQYLGLCPDVSVVAEAGDGATLLEKLRTTPVDLVLLDLNMPGLCDADLIARLHSAYPALAILVLSMHNETQTVMRAMKAGASGYISKNCMPSALLDAIRKVMATGKYLPPNVAEQLAFASACTRSGDPLETLSEREQQIYRLLVQGESIGDIARQLCISDKTVSTHKSNMLNKLGLRNVAELVRHSLTRKQPA